MIRVSHDGPVATITLDRPDRRNALTPDMLGRLAAAIPEAARASRCLVLAGAGKVLCAGFDLSLCKDDHSGSVMRSLLTGLSRAVRALREVPVPVVIAAHGAAIAGGCALLGGGDVVITDDQATLGYPVTRMGISPAVSAPFLRLSIGDAACRERLLDSGLISGADAVRLGLAHESLAGADDVIPRSLAVAAGLAEKPAGAMAATKSWLNQVSPVGTFADAALGVSLGLAGGPEERSRLAQLWRPAAAP